MTMETALNDLLETAVQSGAVPGVVGMLIDRDKTLYAEAFGKRCLGQNADMTTDTVGLLASMSKAVTAVGVMQLVEQGRLDLDSPASKWLPELGTVQVLTGFDEDGTPQLRLPKRPVTLRHLLT